MSPAASLVLATCALACAPAASPPPPPELQVLDWPGRDGRRLALDQPLRISFDRRMPSNLRAGSVELLELGESRSMALPRPLQPLALVAAGEILSLIPALPRATDLEDGTLRPGRRYRLIFHGVPSLRALASADGAVLVGDQYAEFETLPEADPGVIGNTNRAHESLSLDLPSGRGARLLAWVGADGRVQVPVRMPLDPRSLREPAWLRPLSPEAPGAVPAQAVALRLLENGAQGALLEATVGALEEPIVLVLPELLEGLSGERLHPADRELRLQPVP